MQALGTILFHQTSSHAQNTAEADLYRRIGGSVVECSPATRAARVRFPADAVFSLLSTLWTREKVIEYIYAHTDHYNILLYMFWAFSLPYMLRVS